MSGVIRCRKFSRFDTKEYGKVHYINKFSEIKRNIGKRCDEAMKKDLEEKRKENSYKKLLYSKTHPKLTLPLKNNKNNLKTNKDIYHPTPNKK